jgi:hypothetical protein
MHYTGMAAAKFSFDSDRVKNYDGPIVSQTSAVMVAIICSVIYLFLILLLGTAAVRVWYEQLTGTVRELDIQAASCQENDEHPFLMDYRVARHGKAVNRVSFRLRGSHIASIRSNRREHKYSPPPRQPLSAIEHIRAESSYGYSHLLKSETIHSLRPSMNGDWELSHVESYGDHDFSSSVSGLSGGFESDFARSTKVNPFITISAGLSIEALDEKESV